MKEKVISILKDIRPEFDFTDDVDFIDEGMLDSFDIVTLVDSLETEFGIIIEGLDIIPDNFKNVAEISNLIKRSKKV